jgi:galactokinase
VLPCAIDFATYVAARERDDRTVRTTALDIREGEVQFGIEQGYRQDTTQPWSNYIRAVTQVLIDEGHALCGADFLVSGDIPQGAGLSSSASLCVGIAKAFDELCELNLSPMALSQIAQAAENRYVGCNCGIMDQVASAMSAQGHATLLDCDSLDSSLIPIPQDLHIAIIHSGISRGLIDSEYNSRRRDCETASRHFGVPNLRHVSLEQLERHKGQLNPNAFKRACHVVSENQRVLAFADALRHGNFEDLGAIMAASHRSMRDDFEITTPEIDLLVECVNSQIGSRGGSRMTGGGFGGCVVALCENSALASIQADAIPRYQEATGRVATLYSCSPCAGASILEPKPE